MPRPLITFRGIPRSEALEGLVREKAEKLATLYDKIDKFTVVIEEPHRHHNQGNHFVARVTVHVPGDEIVAARDAPKGENEDAFFAVTHAFEAARRQLEDWLRRLRDAKREPKVEIA